MKTIQVSEETYEAIKDQLGTEEKLDISGTQDLVGKNWFIRTVTYHLIGKINKIFGNFAVMEQASWIPDSGRFMDAIKNGALSEVEPVGEAIVNLSSVTDFFPWKHKLPTEQK